MFKREDSSPKTGSTELLVDIGSGSIGVAIINGGYNQSNTKSPACIWSDRVHMPLKSSSSSKTHTKALKSALMEAALLVNSQGSEAAKNAGFHLHIKRIHVSLAAPWVQTFTQRVTYRKDKPFALDEALLKKLRTENNQHINENLDLLAQSADSKPATLEDRLAHFELNGYARGKLSADDMPITLNSFAFTHYLTFLSEDIKNTIEELFDDTFGQPEIHLYPFMLLFAETVLETTDKRSFCLFDITHEGTEIGIVRESSISTVAQLPVGIATLAREIADTLKAPETNGFHYLEKFTSSNNKPAVEEVLTAFQRQLRKVLNNLPDGLVPPAVFFTHCDSAYEDFFSKEIKAALLSTLEANITPEYRSSTKLINEIIPYTGDSALSVLCYRVFKQKGLV